MTSHNRRTYTLLYDKTQFKIESDPVCRNFILFRKRLKKDPKIAPSLSSTGVYQVEDDDDEQNDP